MKTEPNKTDKWPFVSECKMILNPTKVYIDFRTYPQLVGNIKTGQIISFIGPKRDSKS